MEHVQPGTNKDEAKEIKASVTQFTIRETKCYCSEKQITNNTEQGILLNLIRFGDWVEENEVIIEEGKVIGVKLVYSPQEITDQGFEIIGLLSSMISNRFKEQTINNGEIMSLDLSINPKDFSIFIPEGYDSEDLPLWQFIISPKEKESVVD